MQVGTVPGNSVEGVINPLSAMVTRWQHIIVSFKVFGTERVHWNLDLLDNMFMTRPFDANGNSVEGVISPLSAMVARWHHIIVSFKVFGTERVHWNLDLLDELRQ